MASPARTTTTTIPMTDDQLKAPIDQGVANALATRNANRNGNCDASQGSGSGIARPVRPTRECTYTDFLKYQPINFKGTEGFTSLTLWFERMESVFNISNCVVENQVKFAICTLYGTALTWWKSYVKTVGQDASHCMPWSTLMKMMTDAIEFATELMDKKIRTFAKRQTENKIKQDDNQQQQNKKQNTGRAYTAGPGEKKPYEGSKPLC
ncbi:hypothetical protein Tco_1069816 [Tanacetum coccineum]|uniref:Retrotransposon gag domain-containing protein n=1 Tax=Tanacetum coccineum TaxID=301880 RepID=A0ABQ5HKR9_9ASTR